MKVYTICVEIVTLDCHRHRDLWAQLLAQNDYDDPCLGAFWVMICNLVGGYHHFRRLCCISVEASRSSYFFQPVPLWQILFVVRAQKLRSQTVYLYLGMQLIHANWFAPSDKHTSQTFRHLMVLQMTCPPAKHFNTCGHKQPLSKDFCISLLPERCCSVVQPMLSWTLKKSKNVHALKVIIFENPKHHKQIPRWCGKLVRRVFQSLP